MMAGEGKWRALKGLRFGEALLAVAVLAACVLLWSRSAGSTGLEGRMERVLSQVEGAGRVRVLLNGVQDDSPVTGAVIVAEGADSVRVLLELQRAAATLLNLDLNQVEVLNMGEAGP